MPGPAICARCNVTIHQKEMVMHAKEFVYHVSCFNCSHCSRVLTTGDHFGMKDSHIFCREHFEMLTSPPLSLSGNPAAPSPITSTSPTAALPNLGPPPPHTDFSHLPPPNANPLSAIPGFTPTSFAQGVPPLGFPAPQLPGDALPPAGYPLPQPDPSVMNHQAIPPPKSQKGRPKKKKAQPEDAFQGLYGPGKLQRMFGIEVHKVSNN